jgi:hypothetical protein
MMRDFSIRFILALMIGSEIVIAGYFMLIGWWPVTILFTFYAVMSTVIWALVESEVDQ